MQARTLASLLAFAAAAGAAWADPAGCFCLSNDRYGYFEWGCVAGEGGAESVVCLRDAADGVVATQVTVGADWRRVPEGSGLCLPCMPPVVAEDLPVRFRGLYAEALDEADNPNAAALDVGVPEPNAPTTDDPAADEPATNGEPGQ